MWGFLTGPPPNCHSHWQMNKYPGKRTFTAIGSGGSEFRAAMVQAVEAVVGPVPEDCVAERPSSKVRHARART